MEELNVVDATHEPNVEAQPAQDSEPVNAGEAEVATATEKTVQTPDENAKFAEVRRKAEAAARDKTIAEMGMEWNGSPITTYEQYVKAKAESEEAARREALQEKGVDPTIVDEYIENNPTVKEAKQLLAEKKEQERKQKEYAEFFEYFQTETGRAYDPAKDTIPPEVWTLTQKGKTLTDAYAYQMNKILKDKVAELEGKLLAKATNEENAAASTGSITGGGGASPDFISLEMFEANRKNQDWVNRNYDKINQSRAKW